MLGRDEAERLAETLGIERPPRCWTCEKCGDVSPLYPLYNYCRERGVNIVGDGCYKDELLPMYKTEDRT